MAPGRAYPERGDVGTRPHACNDVPQNNGRCANCGLTISWQSLLVDGIEYCCGGCALGGPCYCSYDDASPVVPPSDGAEEGHSPETITQHPAKSKSDVPRTGAGAIRDALSRINGI